MTMTRAFSAEEVDQITNNTLLVMLARPDLLDDWHESLLEQMHELLASGLESEAIFAAAVLSLLHAPGDSLPTGTDYDYAWDAILNGLHTGTIQTGGEAVSLERLLSAVAEATVAVLTVAEDQRSAIARQIRELRASAIEADARDLAIWLDDVLALLDGVPVDKLGAAHQDIYAAYWQALVNLIPRHE